MLQKNLILAILFLVYYYFPNPIKNVLKCNKIILKSIIKIGRPCDSNKDLKTMIKIVLITRKKKRLVVH